MANTAEQTSLNLWEKDLLHHKSFRL